MPLQVGHCRVKVTKLEQPHRYSFVVNCETATPAPGIPGHVCGWQHHALHREEAVNAARYHIIVRHRPDLTKFVDGQAVVDTAEVDKLIEFAELKQALPPIGPVKGVTSTKHSGAGAPSAGLTALPKVQGTATSTGAETLRPVTK